MLMPKKVKFRKQQRGRMKGKAWTGSKVAFGDYGLKPQETRMGKGKGAPEQWVMVVKPGRILYEMEGVPEKDAREALRLAAHKLSIRTKFVKRLESEVAI